MPKSESLNKSTKIILNYVLGGALFIWLTYAIYQQLIHQQNLPAALAHMQSTILEKGLLLLLLVVVLMFVNWGLEAKKWQMLVAPLEAVPFARAFGAILSGVTLSVNTPNRIGEYGGRILYLENRNKLKAIAATIVGSYSQLIITIVFGLCGLIYYINNFQLIKADNYFAPNFWEKLLLGILIVICVFIVILYFRLQIIVAVFEKVPLLRKLKVFIQIIARYSPGQLRKLLLLSTLRYMVFTAQYLILLYALGVTFVWWQGFFMINMIYLIMAIVPTIAIAELGLRGQVSIYFLGLLSANTAGIVAGTVAIWLINLVLPAAIGSILLLGVKIFKDK
ncbi:lysylphosphatidylglycerol synthase domain-containing protein [Chitinophaga sp. XS-30]|uniref:lysylphosphatidylglycerol synthase domain-containing protein n=1 Tax=Chitinophaga sp. XS-30 TaxID=2604421 RepID=UPI00143CD59B|nr:lysylphosphatidylglycerol synthase domain-containing protein [Chitinophaga sp. XS-30]